MKTKLDVTASTRMTTTAAAGTSLKAEGEMKQPEAAFGLKTTTQIKAGGIRMNHSQSASGLKLKTGAKAGGMKQNHSQSAR